MLRNPLHEECWPAVPLKLTPNRFESGDVTLAGLLIEPVVEDGQYPLVVAVHGSENTASIRRNGGDRLPRCYNAL